MNRKYIYGLVLAILTGNVQYVASEEWQNHLFRCIAHAVLISGGTYVCGKAYAEYREGTLQDVPPHVEQWARNVLSKNGLEDADKVSLKMGNGANMSTGSFIEVDPTIALALENILSGTARGYEESDYEKICVIAEGSLLREKKYYDDGVFGKKCLLHGATYGFVSLMTKNGPVGTGSSIATSIAYTVYKKNEAERYAYAHVSNEKFKIV